MPPPYFPPGHTFAESTPEWDPLICLIKANPDIAGLGAHLSLYCQVYLSIIIALFAAVDGKITEEEETSTKIFPLSNLVLSMAVSVSGLCMGTHLGDYHAAIMLSTGFISNLSRKDH